jgi:hypothetical protein
MIRQPLEGFARGSRESSRGARRNESFKESAHERAISIQKR